MKKRLALAMSLYSPYLLWELVLVVQVILFFACSVALVSNFVGQQQVYRSFADIFTGENIYFQPYDRLVEIFLDPDTDAATRSGLSSGIRQGASEMAPGCDIGRIVHCFGECDGQPVKVIGYNHVMTDRLGISDHWMHMNVSPVTGYPVLIRGALSSRFNIGDQFHVTLSDEPSPLQVTVIGKLRDDFQVILPSYGATDPTIDSFFDRDIISADPLVNANTIIFLYTETDATWQALGNPACFIFAGAEGIIPEKLENQSHAVGGKYFAMDELINNTITQNIYINRSPLSKVFASSLFTLVSLFGYVFLLFIRNQKLFGVCTILGMSRRYMLSVINIAVGLCVGVSVFLYAIYNVLTIHLGVTAYSDSGMIVIVYAAALVFVALLSGSLTCSLLISRWQPVEYLRGD